MSEAGHRAVAAVDVEVRLNALPNDTADSGKDGPE